MKNMKKRFILVTVFFLSECITLVGMTETDMHIRIEQQRATARAAWESLTPQEQFTRFSHSEQMEIYNALADNPEVQVAIQYYWETGCWTSPVFTDS